MFRCRAQVTWCLHRSLYWGENLNRESLRATALQCCTAWQWEVGYAVKNWKAFIAHAGRSRNGPASSKTSPVHMWPINSSHCWPTGGACLGGQEELHSAGGFNVKIVFYVYFNFTECWVWRVKAPGLQQLPVYLGSTDSQQQGKGSGGGVHSPTVELTPGW